MAIVSFIMPVYNVQDYLTRSIESILHQNYKDWELLIINDGSTDNSGEICKKYSKNDKRVKYFYQHNQGSGIARNKGLANAQGKYIVFIDPDDYLNNDSLEKNLLIMEKYNSDVIVNGYYELRKEKNRTMINKKYLEMEGNYNDKKFRENFNDFEKISSRSLWNKMYKKEFLDKNDIRFTDQRVGQDALFNYEVYRITSSVFINQNAYYTYDSTREGSAVKKYNPNRVEYELNIVNKYRDMFLYWNKYKDYKIKIAKSYFQVLIVELINLNLKDSPVGYKTKVKKIKILLENEKINESLHSLSMKKIDTPFLKIIFLLAKNKKHNALLILFKYYVEIKM